MKKLIAIRFEDVIVNDFRLEDSFTRKVRKEIEQIKNDNWIHAYQKAIAAVENCHGRKEMDDVECVKYKKRFKRRIEEIGEGIKEEIDIKEQQIVDHIEKKRKVFIQGKIGDRRIRKGMDVLIKSIINITTSNNMGVGIVVVSDYGVNIVRNYLYRNGIQPNLIINSSVGWVDTVLEKMGKERKDMILFSNKKEDYQTDQQLGIKVERIKASETIDSMLDKMGLRKAK